MSTDRYAARRQKLLGRLRKSEADALLVSSVTNVTYLTGFTGDSSYLLIGRDQTVLVSDSRYATQIGEECPGLDVHIRTKEQTTVQAVGDVVNRAKLAKLGFESGSTTYAEWEQLQKEIKQLQLVPLSGLVEELREIKDAHEIARIREAIDLAQRGFAVLRASLTLEMTEARAAHELEQAIWRFGGRGLSFEPIVAVGTRAALPHARPAAVPMSRAGFVLVDWGADGPGGYKSDLTRLLTAAKIPPKLEKVYGLVLTAQRRGIAAIRPGAMGRDVDAAARRVIDRAGYARYFGHGLGHGIGLDIHEGPRLSPISQSELKPGMVVTVEPGIYIPGWGGVRIEDDVLVTRDGCEVLSSVPKELDDCRIEGLNRESSAR